MWEDKRYFKMVKLFAVVGCRRIKYRYIVVVIIDTSYRFWKATISHRYVVCTTNNWNRELQQWESLSGSPQREERYLIRRNPRNPSGTSVRFKVYFSITLDMLSRDVDSTVPCLCQQISL